MSKSDPSKTSSQTPSPEDAGAHKTAPGGAEAYARWLERMQRTRTRHAAITRNLYSWSSYKSWADKMRSDWQAEEQKG